jgi:hypothetical protein
MVLRFCFSVGGGVKADHLMTLMTPAETGFCFTLAKKRFLGTHIVVALPVQKQQK